MRSIKILLVFCAFALFVVACNSDQKTSTTATTAVNAPATSNTAPVAVPSASASPADELAEARATYGQVCARCHKPDGTGGVFKDESGDLKVPNLHEGRAVKRTDEQLARKITNGGDGMPGFGKRLSPEKINALVRFVRVEFQGQK